LAKYWLLSHTHALLTAFQISEVVRQEHDLKSALPLAFTAASHVTQTLFDPVTTIALPSPQSHNPASAFQTSPALEQVHVFPDLPFVNVPAVPHVKHPPLARTTCVARQEHPWVEVHNFPFAH